MLAVVTLLRPLVLIPKSRKEDKKEKPRKEEPRRGTGVEGEIDNDQF